MNCALVCAGLMVTLLSEADSGAPVDRDRAYQEIRASAGRSADEQVRLALWCEAHGMPLERLNHLTLAVLADPTNARARGLMGMVPHDGRFQHPEAVAEKVKADPLLAEYDAKRSKAPYTAEGQWALGVWADQHGLIDQAHAHFTAVIRLDPKRSDAWRRLGYRLHDGRWLTQAQFSAEKAEAETQKQADRKWRPILEDWRKRLATDSGEKRETVEAELSGLADPRAVPSILRVFAGLPREQPRAVQLLGQVDSPGSSKALAILAVAARSSEARRAATETLRRRNPLEFAQMLIGLLGEQIRFEVKPVDGPNSPGVLLVEGKQVNVRRVYTPPSTLQPGDRVSVDDSGMAVLIRLAGPAVVEAPRGFILDPDQAWTNGLSPGEIRQAQAIISASSAFRPLLARTKFEFYLSGQVSIPLEQMVAEGAKSAQATAIQLENDVRMLLEYNFDLRIANSQVASVLSASTGQELPADRRTWTNWWIDQVGYASPSSDWKSKPSIVEDVDIAYQPPVVPDGAAREIDGYSRMSCFAAGTSVQTIAGPRAIESLQVGDRVLTQDVTSGSLGYEPILVVHHNPPGATFRIKVKGTSIVSTPFHRFWVAGRGWVMTRDLKTGDSLRTLGGVSAIDSIEPDAVQPVYNLDVAGAADYFVGPAEALVHDNTPPNPRLIPFDQVSAAGAAALSKR